MISSAGLNKNYDSIRALFEKGSVKSLKTLHSKAYTSPPYLPDFIYNKISQRLLKLPIDHYMEQQTKSEHIDLQLKNLKKIPTLLLWGKNDQVIPLDHAYEMNDLIEGSELRIIDQCAHIAQKQCLSNVFEALLYLQSNAMVK